MKRPPARTLMILAAERLIAERGIDAVSLREIGAAAGQRNNSAAQYHFATKEKLVAAIYEHRMRPMNAERHTMLTTIAPTGDLAELRALAEVVVVPLLVEITPHETFYARFLVQLSARGAWAGDYPSPDRSLQSSVMLVRRRLVQIFAEVPSVILDARLRLAFGLTVDIADDLERGLIEDRAMAVTVAVDSMVATLIGPASLRSAMV